MNEIPPTINYDKFESGYQLSKRQQVVFSIIVLVALVAIAVGVSFLLPNRHQMALLQGLDGREAIVGGALIGGGASAIGGVLAYLTYQGIRLRFIKAAFETNDDNELEFTNEKGQSKYFWEFPLFGGIGDKIKLHTKTGDAVTSQSVTVIDDMKSPPPNCKEVFIRRSILKTYQVDQEASGASNKCVFARPAAVITINPSIQTVE